MSGGVDSSVAAALPARAGVRRHRRDPQAVGRRVRLRLLQRRRRRGRPARRRAARHPALRVQLHRRLRRRRRRSLRRRARGRPHAQPVRRVQPLDQVRPAPRARRRARVRPRRDRPPRARRRAATAGPSSCDAGPTRRRTSRTSSTCSGSGSSPVRCSRSATLTKADVREHAARLGLRTAAKPESMDVCFITRGGRRAFLDRTRAGARRCDRRHRRRDGGPARQRHHLHGRAATRSRRRDR